MEVLFSLQVTTWGRKAQACGFHLLPVPGDPFALPSAPDSDPLRGPIFVPLDIASLSQGGKAIFHGENIHVYVFINSLSIKSIFKF
jgi:hypothetical protein